MLNSLALFCGRSDECHPLTTFTIDSENGITSFGTKQQAESAQGEDFSTERELLDLAAIWPVNRLIEI
jgi:hypothetical protein